MSAIKISSGIWQVAYNAENLPVCFVDESAKKMCIRDSYEYDGEGRVTLEAEPWAGGGEQLTRTEYAGLRFYDNRPARVAESRALSDGTEIELTSLRALSLIHILSAPPSWNG